MAPLDRRLAAARPDLADRRLSGRVEAARFVDGVRRRMVAPSAPLRREPRPDAPLDTEVLAGEAVLVFDDREGVAWVQLETDGYVGYVPSEALGPDGPAPSHRVSALRTFLYPGPDLKLPPQGFLSFGAGTTPIGTSGDYVRLATGAFVFARHLAPADAREPDPVAVAERFAGTPYLWGGRTSLGLDCSALVQLALAAAGIAAPRDSDLQAELGEAVPHGPDDRAPRRGDLVFWRGHVGLMVDEARLLHANGHAMAVSSEPLAVAEARILAGGGGPITRMRRMPGGA